ncbi:MAG: hypothetical protein FJX35_07300 [Alphaproteobacteria bacterium]|nr:hypothetical protein [Alphaproteobacteria bacterium]
MVKILLSAVLALIVFLMGGIATVQWLAWRDTYPWAVVVAAFWLGGLVMTWLVMELGHRVLKIIGAVGDEPEPEPKGEDEDEDDDLPPARGRPSAGAKPGKPVAPALSMPGQKR